MHDCNEFLRQGVKYLRPAHMTSKRREPNRYERLWTNVNETLMFHVSVISTSDDVRLKAAKGGDISMLRNLRIPVRRIGAAM
jgi:hypothetical protein